MSVKVHAWVSRRVDSSCLRRAPSVAFNGMRLIAEDWNSRRRKRLDDLIGVGRVQRFILRALTSTRTISL